ncbi:carbohydrate kinase family protein [Bosea psychrotolerans]|uniref:Fructokinase n=1 Tax=Bosea psychrotolerans TaxID=1871628 RepID=A0A2S4ME79_9HYPH|nr:carbohydrate kinase [Bosea psychrotolerans]POR53034.1 fructokinase [Bosea psychrotolerans]
MTQGVILVTGEVIGDFIPRDGEGRHYEAVLGGSGFNAALALARFGARVAYAGALSTDALGRRFRTALASEGIDASLVHDSARPSAIAIVAPLGPGGVPEFGLYLDGTAHAEPEGTPRSCPPGTIHLHATSFGATVGPSGEATLALIESAKAQGASISYDVNVRASVLPERAPATALIEQRIALADIVKVSLDDLAWLHPDWSADEVVAHWRGLGAACVLVTRGGQGASCHSADGLIESAAPPVAVADTVGAGDSFIGGALAVLARRGLLGPNLALATRGDWQAALAFACDVAADSCTRPGCDPPRRSAVEA